MLLVLFSQEADTGQAAQKFANLNVQTDALTPAEKIQPPIAQLPMQEQL